MALSPIMEAHLDAIEDALGTKIKNRPEFVSAFNGLVSCCGGEPDEDDSGEMEGDAMKSAPDIALVLGKKAKP